MNKLFTLLATFSCFFSLNAHNYPERFEGIIHCKETEVLDLISRIITKDPIILEAGAHYGIDTVKFVKTWPNATILSFEPNPNAYERLIHATKNFDIVKPYNLALSNYNGEATLHVCYGTEGNEVVFEGASSLLEASEGMKIHYQGPKVTVPCVVLDDFCKENGIDHIDFMWLDMAGMENQALKSSPEILKTVSMIFVETNFQEFRIGMSQYSELKSFLEESGFTLLSHWYYEGLQGNALFMRK